MAIFISGGGGDTDVLDITKYTYLATLDSRYYANPGLLVDVENSLIKNIDPVDQLAYFLDQKYDYSLLPNTIENNYWIDSRGWDEKYLASFFIRPNGDSYRWLGSNVGIRDHEYLGRLSSKYYDDPSLLVDVENPLFRYLGPMDLLAYELDQKYNFRPDFISQDHYYNSRGWDEKYWPNFFIRPNGFLYQWKGSLETSIRIAILDSKYYDNPTLLVNVVDPSLVKRIFEGSSKGFGSIDVFVEDSSAGSTKIIIGSKILSLSNINPSSQATVSNQVYTVKLIDVSDIIAKVKVACGNVDLTTQCSDSLDNDNDGQIDYPKDNDCSDLDDDTEESPVVCTDSDGGKDYFIEGTVNGLIGEEQFTLIDNCDTPTDKVIEYYCEGNQIKSEEYECVNGCQDGACVRGEEICIEGSSELKEINESSSKVINGVTISMIDAYESPFVLSALIKVGSQEFNLTTDNPSSQVTVNSQIFKIELVSASNTAAIIKVTTCVSDLSCTDSDGGRDYYVDGYVEMINDPSFGIDGRKYDNCWEDGINLVEYVCIDGDYKGDENYLCPNGCQDGACVRNEVPVDEGVDECLDDPDNYWDQKTNKCYSGYSDDIIEGLCFDPDDGENYYKKAHTFGFRETSTADDPSRDLRIRTGGLDFCDLSVYNLDQQYDFQSDYISFDHYYDSRGSQERYLPGFFILSSGDLYQWGGGDPDVIDTTQHTYLATLDSRYYVNPGLLVDVDILTIEVIENYCDANGYIQTRSFECPNGCQDGACIKVEECNPQFSCEISPLVCPPHGTQIKECKDVKCESKGYKEEIQCTPGECSGCLLEGKCIPYGFRVEIDKNNVYCEISGEFKEQRTKDFQGNWASCQNSYECESNLCSSGECIEIADAIREAGRFKSLIIRAVCLVGNLFDLEEYRLCVFENLGEVVGEDGEDEEKPEPIPIPEPNNLPEETAPLFTSGTKIYVNDSLNKVKTVLSKNSLPTLLASGSFSGNIDAKYTQIIKIGSPKLVYKKQPTSADEPNFGFALSTNPSGYTYNATVIFSKAVNFSHPDSKGEDIILFGQKFIVGSDTDTDTLVLLKDAGRFDLDSDNYEVAVIFEDSIYIIELFSASDTSATIKVTDSSGSSETREVNEATSRNINGITISVINADETNIKLSATIIVGINKITFEDGSAVTVGQDDITIDGTLVDFGTGNPNNITSFTVSIYAPESDKDAIREGESFVDPVFGTFKIDFDRLVDEGNRKYAEVYVRTVTSKNI